MKLGVRILPAVVLLLAGVPGAHAGTIYSAKADFSLANGNPNGVWSYGYSATVGGALILYPDYDITKSIWLDNQIQMAYAPSVFVHGSGNVAFHPGFHGEYSVIRFTAPESASYALTSRFLFGNILTTTDVHVLSKGVEIFAGSVSFAPEVVFNQTLNLAMGDIVDFRVGFGADQDYQFDTTLINAVFETNVVGVPEPASLALLVIGFVGAAGNAIAMNLWGYNRAAYRDQQKTGTLMRWCLLLTASFSVLLSGQQQTSAATLLGLAGSNLYSIDDSNAQLTLIGNTGQALLGDIQYAPNGTLYALGIGTSSNLYSINPLTAQATLIGPFGRQVFEGGLAFAPNGTAYGAIAGNANTPQLLQLNLDTGAATVIGVISGGSHDINGLTYRSDGMLIGLDRVTNSLLVIDPTTAASSVLATLLPTVGAVGGMTSDGTKGYFSTSGPSGTFPGSNSLYSFDLYDGSYSLVGSFAPTITDIGVRGITMQPVPEPASLALAGVGLAYISGFAWRRRKSSSAARTSMPV